jgi:hypothetical protein
MSHNYLKKLWKLHQEGKLDPALCKTDIYHDDWCGIYAGGYCNCDPEIEVRKIDERGLEVPRA